MFPPRLLRPLAAAALSLTIAAAPAGLAQQPVKGPALPPINPGVARLDQTVEGLGGPGLALAADDRAGMVAAACEDGTVQFWHRDVLLGVRRGSSTCNVLPGHRGPIVSLAWNGGPVLASAGVDRRILLRSAADGRVLHALPADQTVRALALSPDGRLLAAAGDDMAVQLWEVDTGKAGARLAGHTDWVLSLAFSPDGDRLASAGYDGVIRLWDVAAGKKLRDMSAAPPPPPKTVSEPVIVWSLAFSPDGKELAAGTAEGPIHMLNPADGKVLRSLPGHGSAVTGLQYHPGGAVLASASKDRTVRLWNPANGQVLKALEGHEAWVQGVAFVAQGTRLVSVGADRTVRLWDLTTPAK
jgi:WD40 repeat protein